MPRHYYHKNLKSKITYGGSYHENLQKVLRYVDPQKIVNYKNWEDTQMTFRDKTRTARCCCNHEVMYIHIVRHKKTGDTLEIGTTCINKFHPDDKKAIAEVHKRVYKMSNKSTPCERCNRSVTTKVVEEFKRAGMTKFYHKKCLNMCYQCLRYKNYTCQCHHANALSWKLKYGKYTGCTMREMLQCPKKRNHIAYLLRTSKSETLLKIMKDAITAPTPLIQAEELTV